MITEDYVSYEIAKLLKEKGFEGENRDWYNMEGFIEEFGADDGIDPTAHEDIFNSIIPAPTLQMAMKWLRKEHNLEIYPYHNSPDNRHNSGWWFEIIKYPNSVAEYESGIDEEVDTYEEACEAAIKYCLEKLI